MEPAFNYQSLRLPHGSLPANRADVGLDVGGTLAKLAYCSPANKESNDGLELRMVTFDAGDIEGYLSYIQRHVVRPSLDRPLVVAATGVGCLKHKQTIRNTLQVPVSADDRELEHAARALDVLWRSLPADRGLYNESDTRGLTFETSLEQSGLLPCILVNIGSAMTIVKIDQDKVTKNLTKAEVVGGSSQGGLTFLGLGALLTQAKTYKELVDLALGGDHHNVDLLVRDTAGAGYSVATSDCLVSSFGKAARQNNGRQFSEQDVASSLLYATTDQLAQTIYLVARNCRVQRAVFCGFFAGQNSAIMRQLRDKLAQCSVFLKEDVWPVFVKNEGYLGAIGALSAGGHTTELSNSTPDI
ncbi:4'-phosphopantetheine phosphatase [Lamellibrachia satsuma]|nr:4'-phosphopantetheine phosphatase [Lamellibrachia satsuma]